MNRRLQSRRTQAQAGAAMVELTIVLPLLLLLWYGIGELGRAFYSYNTLNKLVQDGARHLSANSLFGSTSTVQFDDSGPDGNAYQARNLIVYGTVSAGTTPLLPGLSDDDINISSPAPGLIQVDVSYGYVPMIGDVFNPFGLGEPIALNFTLNASITLRAL